jgi:hypothetical protein
MKYCGKEYMKSTDIKEKGENRTKQKEQKQ